MTPSPMKATFAIVLLPKADAVPPTAAPLYGLPDSEASRGGPSMP